jgi:DNA primase
MPAIKPTCVRDLKLRVNIVDVISRVVTLRKAGARFKGLCPFHTEKTPSFNVDADKGFFKCFGCGKAGDAIAFVRETEQLSFTEAIETLGKRFGVVIEYEEGSGPTKEERSLRQELFDLHEQAVEHYTQVFRAKSATGDYMRRYWTEARRFTAELAEEFRIGAAEPDDTGLAAALMKRRFSEDALRQSGLFFVREHSALTLNSLRPRFRGRLMIPIRDHQGRVVAFTARQTTLTPEDDPAREAKYVNSPETPIFTKGHLLFNLDRAREVAGKENQPFVLVEGQLDALRCWSVGLKTAIAPQGTAITDAQLLLLRRYQTRVECFFDGDSAGQKAALRFLPLALKAGLEVRFLGAVDKPKSIQTYSSSRKVSPATPPSRRVRSPRWPLPVARFCLTSRPRLQKKRPASRLKCSASSATPNRRWLALSFLPKQPTRCDCLWPHCRRTFSPFNADNGTKTPSAPQPQHLRRPQTRIRLHPPAYAASHRNRTSCSFACTGKSSARQWR